jgi:hypothetical protein
MCAQAENERMHLLTFLQVSQPGYLTRMMVLLTQGIVRGPHPVLPLLPVS